MDELDDLMQAQEQLTQFQAAQIHQLQNWVYGLLFFYLLSVLLVYLFLFTPPTILNLLDTLKRWLKR